jgi:transcriptional regulator with XRE-family HTH domain
MPPGSRADLEADQRRRRSTTDLRAIRMARSNSNEKLRNRRLAVPLTQAELAERVGVAEITVRKWERGIRPQPEHVRRLCDALEATPEDLGLSPGTPETGSYAEDVDDLTNPLSRRRFLRGMAEVGGAAVAGGLIDEDRFAYALDHPARIDEHVLDDLVVLTQLYASKAQAIAPATLLPAVLNLMRRIRAAMVGSHPEGIRRRLQLLYAENATIAGRLAFWNDDRGQAAELLKVAGKLAGEVDERQLRALILAFRGDLHSTVPYIGTVPNNTNLALALFDEAAALDGPDWPPLLRAWVLGCRAEEYATLKRATESDRDMDDAHRAVDAVRGEASLVHVARALDITGEGVAGLSGFEGACALALGRSTAAREAFEAGLREAPSVGRLSGLAAAYALEGDIESGVELLSQGLDEAVKRQLPTRRRRVEGVRAAYFSHAQDHPAVQRFDEQLRTILG